MNRALRRLSVATLVMFLLLLININYLQGFDTASLANDPGNSRAFEAQDQYQRGSIVTADGKVIAGSKQSAKGDSLKWQRYYPAGPLYAPVTGYDSIYSETGLEQTENSYLSGNGSQLAIRNFLDLITGKTTRGATVQTTINSKAQQAAYNALLATGKEGGVVAVVPQTGAIVAMVSNPSFDPNKYATHDGDQLNAADKTYRLDPAQPLLDRAINVTYPPGSTFKIVTSASVFSTTSQTPNSVVPAPSALPLPQTNNKLINFDGEACGDGSGRATIIQAFTQSCNTVFGQLGMNVGTASLNQYAQAFGFNNQNLTIPLPVVPSQYTQAPSQALTAYTAIGQFDDTATPLQEAMLASAVANNGTLMKPYLVQQVTASDLSVVQRTNPSVLSQAVSSNVASELQSMMLSVVNSPQGTAHVAAFGKIPGVQIYGKTGTAQNGLSNGDLNDAVFTSFASVNGNPKIAVGVIVKGGGQGADAAAPVAVQVIQAYLQSLGLG